MSDELRLPTDELASGSTVRGIDVTLVSLRLATEARTLPLVTHDGDRAVVWLDGEHDMATAPDVAAILEQVVNELDEDVVVDLSGVTFIGAATVSVLITCRTSLDGTSRRLTVRSPSKCAVRVLDVCGLSDLIEPG